LAVGLFAQAEFTPNTTGNGLFFGGGSGLLMAQLAGVLGVGVFVFAIAMMFWQILKATVGIRVSAEEEVEGLDVGEHGNTAYPDFVSVTGRGSSVLGASAMAEATGAVPARELSKGTV
jgi:Amt family ammonium transporter